MKRNIISETIKVAAQTPAQTRKPLSRNSSAKNTAGPIDRRSAQLCLMFDQVHSFLTS